MTDRRNQRVRAEINLDNIVFNYQQAVKCAGGRPMYCVLKANAYGHGVVQTATALAGAGAAHFAVSTAEEALQLRRHHFTQPILLLGMVHASFADTLAENGVSLAVGSMQAASDYAHALTGRLKIHIKLDTGMGRIGFSTEDAVDEVLQIAAMPCFELEGIFTHFPVSEERSGEAFTALQISRFNESCDALEARGLRIPIRHCANSGAVMNHPKTHCDMVRPGIMLYGYNPGSPNAVELREAMSLRARIVQVHPLKKGESIGYGRAWVAPRDCMIATVSIGYADGLPRSLSSKAPMLVRGQNAMLVGRICMDMCMLDVTGIAGVCAGDYATVFGSDGDKHISCLQLADTAGTIPHEILSGIGARVSRLYFQNGELIDEDCAIEKL